MLSALSPATLFPVRPTPEEGRPPGAPAAGVRPGALSALLQDLVRPEGAAESDRSATLRPGAVIGRFELVRELGRGGFGVVWEARDRTLGRTVAFKAIRGGGSAAGFDERVQRDVPVERPTVGRHEHLGPDAVVDAGGGIVHPLAVTAKTGLHLQRWGQIDLGRNERHDGQP